MGRQYTCDICGKQMGAFDRFDYEKKSIKVHVCNKCSNQIEDLRYPNLRNTAAGYLRKHYDGGDSSPAGKAYIKLLYKESDTDNRDISNDQADKTITEPGSNTAVPENNAPDFSTFLGIIAALCLGGGVIATLVGIFSGSMEHEALAYLGIGAIISGVLLFVIMNISRDIHHMDHTASESLRLQKEILQLLQERKKDA